MHHEAQAVNRYKENFDVDVGRRSCWGNPFSHESKSKAQFIVATRKDAVDLYSYWILGQVELISRLDELKGKKLGCYCLPMSCHASVLAELVNNYDIHKEFSDYSAFW